MAADQPQNKTENHKPRSRLRRWTRAVLLGLAFILIANLIPLAGALIECRIWQSVEAPPLDSAEWGAYTREIPDYARREDQTYLTLPEWYIVFNADEYAVHLRDQNPSSFPHFRAIAQYWRTYYGACGQLRGEYPFNTEYQVIVGVISVSFTIESAVRGLYENTIGRLAELTRRGPPTEEELYAQEVAEEYGNFIHTIPWFRFPFGEKLSGLWRETSMRGPDPIRKWERKLALSVEYGIKAAYGALLGGARDASFAPVTLETNFVATGIDEALLAREPELRLLMEIDDEHAIGGVERYEVFTQVVPRLVDAGVQFDDIAGNDEIMITTLAPVDWRIDLPAGQTLYAMPVLIDPERNRLAINVPVESLHEVLLTLQTNGARIEHLYDY